MSGYVKPLPKVERWSKPFWEGTKAHKLLLKKCKNCGHIDHPPYLFCTGCLHEECEWIEASGKGKIYTFTTTLLGAPLPFMNDMPYTVAMVDLIEGPRMSTLIVEAKPEEIKIGMEVKVVFDDVTEDVTIPKFRPVRSTE
jgi:uncharacterized OB-fold protein